MTERKNAVRQTGGAVMNDVAIGCKAATRWLAIAQGRGNRRSDSDRSDSAGAMAAQTARHAVARAFLGKSRPHASTRRRGIDPIQAVSAPADGHPDGEKNLSHDGPTTVAIHLSPESTNVTKIETIPFRLP